MVTETKVTPLRIEHLEIEADIPLLRPKDKVRVDGIGVMILYKEEKSHYHFMSGNNGGSVELLARKGRSKVKAGMLVPHTGDARLYGDKDSSDSLLQDRYSKCKGELNQMGWRDEWERQ